MLEEEENEPILLVLGVLAAVLMLVIWWFLNNGPSVAPAPATAAVAVTEAPAESTDTAAPLAELSPSNVTVTLGETITLEGTVPSQDIADAMASEAVTLVGAGNVTNNLIVDDTTTTSGGTVTVIGTVVGEDSKSTLLGVLGPLATGAGYVVDDQVTVEELTPSDVVIDVGADGIVLTGTVPDVDVSSRMQAYAAALNPELTDDQIDNQLIIDEATSTTGASLEVRGVVETPSDVEGAASGFEAGPADLGYRLANSLTSNTTELEASLAELFSLDPIEFDSGQAIIRPSEEDTLNRAAEVLIANSDGNVEVQGHTDSQGNANYNLDLSQRRADAVRQYLIGQGVAPDRLTAVGYGPDQPIADNDTDEGRQANRRIVFLEL